MALSIEPPTSHTDAYISKPCASWPPLTSNPSTHILQTTFIGRKVDGVDMEDALRREQGKRPDVEALGAIGVTVNFGRQARQAEILRHKTAKKKTSVSRSEWTDL